MRKYQMEPLPDEVTAKDGTVFNPNAPLEKTEEAPDRRPGTLYGDYIYSEEYWTKRLTARDAEVNGKGLDNHKPIC
jgi:hypothetical protein